MKTEYAFAENINGSEESGIIEIYGMKLICFCDKEQSKIILPALSSSLQNRSTIDDFTNWVTKNYSHVKGGYRLRGDFEKSTKVVNLQSLKDKYLNQLASALSYKEETKNG